MSSLLGEPFLLASYPTASQKLPKSGQSEQHTRTRYVSATCSSKRIGEGYVTMTVQGDGIHVLELSSMHAAVSHTLGPSAFFAAPAVTRFEGSGASTSYAVMQSAPDGINPKERGRTVWRWRDQQSMRPEDIPEPKLSAVFPHPVEHIWAPSSLASHVIAVSPSGEIMLADQDLNLASSSAKPDFGGILIKSWLFQPEECAFLPRSEASTGGVVILCFMLDSDRLKLRITRAHEMGEFKELLECDMGLHENVTDISCDPSGYLSILTQTGEWKFFRLGHEPTGTVTATPLTDSVRLSGLSLDSPSGNRNRKMNGLSLLSVGSSHVLLAGIVGGSSPQITLLLWDLQYSVVLASQTVPIPSTVAYTPKSLPSLELVSTSRTQALLVVSPSTHTDSPRKEGAAHSRSTVFVVPLEVPSVSTIALAMGKAHETRKWLQTTHNPSGGTEQDGARSQMMQSVRSATDQGRPQAAEAAFFAWVEEETARLRNVEHPAEDDEPGSDEDEKPKPAHKASSNKKSRKKVTEPILSHEFVSSALNMVLQPFKSSDSSYSAKIVLYLVDRKAVGNAMVEGGIIPALSQRKDWESIYSALKGVPDLPEADLIILLADVVASHHRHNNSQENSMQVDVPADIPPLAKYLAALVAYTTSPPMLRLALKHHLTDIRDVVYVLEILEGWIARWLVLTPSLDGSVDGSQPPRKSKKKARALQSDDMPPFENIMSFLQSVLDTHFLALLQYSACHNIIEQLTQHFKQQLASVDEMDRLRGPLEHFIRTAAKEARLKRARRGDGDGRKKRKGSGGVTELAVGLYQIEELVI